MNMKDEDWYDHEGNKAISENRIDDAIVVFRKGLIFFPTSEWLQLGLGRAHNRMGDFAIACELLEPLRKAHPGWIIVLANLGRAYLNLGRFSEALSCIEAVTTEPFVELATVTNFADVLYEHRRYEHAARLYKRAIKMAPENAETWFRLGAATQHLRKFNEAVAHLEQAIRIKPDFWSAQSYLGTLLDNLRRTNAAKAVFERIPVEKFRSRTAVKRLIRMCRKPEDRKKKDALERQLKSLEMAARPTGIARVLNEMNARLDRSSRDRARRQSTMKRRGPFWTGEPAIVTKGTQAALELDRLFGKIFDKPASFKGLDRARVIRLDRKLCQDSIVAAAEFLEGYPWLRFLTDRRPNPPSFTAERIFAESGAIGLMFYCAEMLKVMKRRFKPGVIDSPALLRLRQAVSRLEKAVEHGHEHHRAWIELSVAVEK